MENKENKNIETKENDLTKTQAIALDKLTTETVAITKEEDKENFQSRVEKRRQEFFVKYKKEKRLSSILMGGSVLLLMLAIFFVVNENQGMKIGGYVVAGVAVVAMVVYYLFAKNRLPEATKKYIADISLILNQHAFSDDRFNEVSSNPNEKVELADILSDRVYGKCTEIGNRNVVHGHFNKSRFRVLELALYAPADKKSKKAAFVGKYLTLENKLKLDNRVVIHIKGEKDMDLPDSLDDLTVLSEDGNFKVYGEEGLEINSIIPLKVLDAIKAIKVEKSLLGVAICLWGGHTAVYLSYDDTVITLPFDKEFTTGESFDQYRDNLLSVLEVLTEL